MKDTLKRCVSLILLFVFFAGCTPLMTSEPTQPNQPVTATATVPVGAPASPQATNPIRGTAVKPHTTTITPTHPAGMTATPRPLALQQPPLTGDDVLALKSRLYALGYREVGMLDGLFDAQVDVAIRHFQYLNHLEMTGSVDAALWGLIFSTEAVASQPPQPFGGKYLSTYTNPGLWNDNRLPLLLADLGYISPESSEFTRNFYGEETAAAVKVFQKANRLDFTGGVDLETWQMLISPWAVDAAGNQAYPKPAESLQSSIFPIEAGAFALAHDGTRLWVAHSTGTGCMENFVTPLDPKKGLLDIQAPIYVGDCDLANNAIATFIFARNQLWFLLPGETESDIMNFDVNSGQMLVRQSLGDCEYGYCYPSYALGWDGTRLWASKSDRVVAVNPANGKTTGISYPVGFLASGQMVFDGKYMWMPGEVGVTGFHTGGGNVGIVNNLGYQLPATALAFDGKRLWAADYSGYLTWVDLASGTLAEGIYIDGGISALAYDGARLWIASPGQQGVLALDPATRSLGALISLGYDPSNLLFGGKLLWVLSTANQTVQYLDVSDYPIEIVIPTSTPTPAVTATRTFTPTPTAIPELTRTLKLTDERMRGDDVMQLQQRLLALGYWQVGDADGVFGPATAEAVKHFQTNNNLTVDGVVGQQTWAMLFSPDAKGP